MLNQLERLNIQLNQVAGIRAVIGTSDRFSLTIYDAAYLKLAMRSGGDLATSDAALARAGAAEGLKVLTP